MYDLDRFVTAQAPVWNQAIDELRRGRKRSHWMWFVFPQLDGLGRSDMARRYALGSLDEARAYLAHPLLGSRYREAVDMLLAVEDASAERILGPIDAMKLRSSLTLFARAAPEPRFDDALARFFDGPDGATLDLLDVTTRGASRN